MHHACSELCDLLKCHKNLQWIVSDRVFLPTHMMDATKHDAEDNQKYIFPNNK